ncbi:hypothetical protein Patl1_11657 [Pistacia atlantica]|uniref:Uncharacterized protein n=1 Tax=Pistacia atlantica TaxID=434234 RepID=A0ACC1A6J6_9ROSI|nr:hypothetical protein Patl1_11657 [Pistacia atlantica]
MLRLPVIPTEIFPIRVAKGERLTCQGRYDKVRVELQGTEFYLTLFSLPLSSLDLVFSIQWLEMLGSVHAAMPKQHKWVVKLMGYDYEIIYRPGHENSTADTLSRKSSSPVLHHLHVPEVTIWDEIKKAYEGYSYVQSLARMAKTQ